MVAVVPPLAPQLSNNSDDESASVPNLLQDLNRNHRDDADTLQEPRHRHHESIVLFYKYFSPSVDPLWHQHASSSNYYATKMLDWQRDLGKRLGLKGRLALSVEGINGTLSALNATVLQEYVTEMEHFELLRDFGLPPGSDRDDGNSTTTDADGGVPASPSENTVVSHHLFADMDWKMSTNPKGQILEPFPDLKISWVDEIVGSGSSIGAADLDVWGGRHLTPQEFHQTLQDCPDAVLIDVRNSFEYRIGHFVHPHTHQDAINPDTTTFSTFDSHFCQRHADSLRHKKVLLYCTGGIRCEKASAMLRKRGVDDVSQLKGGIHRYLEEFHRDESCFRGLNFVFDQRVAMEPLDRLQDHELTFSYSTSLTTPILLPAASSRDVVGVCLECDAPFDEYCGSRICTVCRDLVLVCPSCRFRLWEYHCTRHTAWKSCYYTFLERFNVADLTEQQSQLEALLTNAGQGHSKNVRKTLTRQIDKVVARITALEAGTAVAIPDAPRRCRTCSEPSEACDGKCWGFWKTAHSAETSPLVSLERCEPMIPLNVGDRVEPGPHWNSAVLGPKDGDGNQQSQKRGVVEELRAWGAGGSERDCALVKWDDCDDVNAPSSTRRSRSQRKLYRWGVLTPTGSRLYDLQRL